MTPCARAALLRFGREAGRDLLKILKFLLYPLILVILIIFDAAKRS